jgi:hypothetical protein
MLQQALNATNVQQEEAGWTAVIEKYERLDRAWVPDVVGRAYGNRGNARSRQVRAGPHGQSLCTEPHASLLPWLMSQAWLRAAWRWCRASLRLPLETTTEHTRCAHGAPTRCSTAAWPWRTCSDTQVLPGG